MQHRRGLVSEDLAAKQRSLRVGGILHGSALRNPDFHAFHRVLLHYCDGGSFTGDRDAGGLHQGEQHR